MFFTADCSRVRVVFGPGVVSRLGDELDSIGVSRPLLVTTPGRARALASVREALGDRLAGVCDRAALHVPIERVREALADVDRTSPDALLAAGGGSAIGLAKAVALERTLPIVAVPTTYAGSEMTGIWGVTDGEIKRTGRDPRAAPGLVLYDPDLTLSLPAGDSAASGMNAIAHAVEAMYAAGAGPIALAAAGAVHMEQDSPERATSVALRSPSPMHHYGTDAIGFSSDREMALSRDSERQALADAAQARLLKAAEQQAAERNAELKSLGRAAEARATAIAENRWKLPLAQGVYGGVATSGGGVALAMVPLTMAAAGWRGPAPAYRGGSCRSPSAGGGSHPWARKRQCGCPRPACRRGSCGRRGRGSASRASSTCPPRPGGRRRSPCRIPSPEC